MMVPLNQPMLIIFPLFSSWYSTSIWLPIKAWPVFRLLLRLLLRRQRRLSGGVKSSMALLSSTLTRLERFSFPLVGIGLLTSWSVVNVDILFFGRYFYSVQPVFQVDVFLEDCYIIATLRNCLPIQRFGRIVRVRGCRNPNLRCPLKKMPCKASLVFFLATTIPPNVLTCI